MTLENPTTRLATLPDTSEREATDLFHREEVQLALRNRGMPLEIMRYPVTPTGMHYLVIHFDIPDVNVDQWKLQVGGLVSQPLSLSLDDIKKRPARTMAVTMECAGNGRALLNPRVFSQPWFDEGIGTAEWTGTPLKGLLDDAGLSDGAVNLVLPGAVEAGRAAGNGREGMEGMARSRVGQRRGVREGKLGGIISIGDVVKNRLDERETETSVLRDYIVGRG